MIRKLLTIGSFVTVSVSSAFAADGLKLEVPNIQEIIPAPPAPSSLIYQNDISVAKASFFSKGNERYKLAQSDAEYSQEGFANAFSQAFGYKISEKNTPAIWKLLGQLEIAEQQYTKPAKISFDRTRPFAYFHETPCVKTDNIHRSYPSGHATIGWAIALILSEINPSRTDEIMKRGYDYGQSRVVCGVHYPSDVQAGYIIGSILFSQLQTNQEFLDELKQAKQEILKQ